MAVDNTNTGTVDKPITFIAYLGHSPIIDRYGVDIPGYQGLVDAYDKDYIVFDSFQIRNSDEFLVKFKSTNNFIIRNCIIHDNSAVCRSGVLISHVDGGLFEHN